MDNGTSNGTDRTTGLFYDHGSIDYPILDCDAHVTEPPLIWERAAEFPTRDELAALRSTKASNSSSTVVPASGSGRSDGAESLGPCASFPTPGPV